jgi:hypothetical protein
MPKFAVPTVILIILAGASLQGWAVVATTMTHPGVVGFNLNTLGTDWMVFYGADQWVYSGQLARIYDGDALTAYLNSTFAHWLTEPMPFRPWVYPPSYLLVVLPFGKLPFHLSYVAFQVVSAGLLAAAVWFGSDRPNARKLVAGTALLGPAGAINVAQGQNAFLTAAMLVGGLRLVQTRPWLGGVVLGMTTIKPQFAVLIPVALLGWRQWRALAASALAAVTLVVSSVAAFGVDSWWQWLELTRSYADPAGKWVAYGRLAGDSVYACLVTAGASLAVADAAQAVASLMGVGLTYIAFRSRLPTDLKIAVLLACTILAAPHSSLHDAVLLALAAALWIAEMAQEEGASLSAWVLALSLWLVPLLNPPETRPVGRLTPLLILGFIAAVFSRLRRPVAAIGHSSPLAS